MELLDFNGMKELSFQEQLNTDGGHPLLLLAGVIFIAGSTAYTVKKVVDLSRKCYEWGYQAGQRSR